MSLIVEGEELLAEEADIDVSQESVQENNLLAEEADRLMGQYFRGYAQAMFNMSLAEETLEAISHFGPRGLTAVVGSTQKSTHACTYYPTIRYHTSDRLDPVNCQNLLVRICGPYVKNLDIFSETERLSDPEEFADIFPNIQPLFEYLNEQQEVAHNLLVVMGMEPELRDIPAVALLENVEPYLEQPVYTNSLQNYVRANCIPSLADMVAVAEQYRVTKIARVLEDMDRVVDHIMELSS